ncbi:hypothetical protein GEMRC1_000549 [Eukaryota sp. GEM-RC1]
MSSHSNRIDLLYEIPQHQVEHEYGNSLSALLNDILRHPTLRNNLSLRYTVLSSVLSLLRQYPKDLHSSVTKYFSCTGVIDRLIHLESVLQTVTSEELEEVKSRVLKMKQDLVQTLQNQISTVERENEQLKEEIGHLVE